jgi:hypothetical protein
LIPPEDAAALIAVSDPTGGLAQNVLPAIHRRQLDHLPYHDELFQSFLTCLHATNRVFVPPAGYHGAPHLHNPPSPSPSLQLLEESIPQFTPDTARSSPKPSDRLPVTLFIGLRRGNLRRTYIQSGLVFESAPCTLDIMEALFACDCIPGRVISKWPQGEIFIGTSRHPVDIESDDYQHHSTQFHEIGRLHDVLDTELPRAELDTVLQPAVDSDRRTHFVDTHGLDRTEQIYILYLWEEVISANRSRTTY